MSHSWPSTETFLASRSFASFLVCLPSVMLSSSPVSA
jgi:hypothetical protein